MQVIAIKPGYFGKFRQTNDKFDVPDGSKASWFVPVEKVKAEKPAKTKEADGLV